MIRPENSSYTCSDYREEMILLGLQKRLSRPDITPEEKAEILKEIIKIEKIMGID